LPFASQVAAAAEGMAAKTPASRARPLSPTPLPQGERGLNATLPRGERGSGVAFPLDEQGSGAALRILAVGRLSYFKGIDVLLRAIAQVPGASLQVVGDGECRGALEQLARELRVESRVRFSGRIDMDAGGDVALQAAYAQADVFCLPSTDRAESFGLVLLEAMRARLPVIASAIPGSGVNYVVRHEETGLLVPPGDATALAAALRRLAGDAPLRAGFGASGQRRWRDEFTLDRSAEQTLELYRRIVPAVTNHAAATPPG